MGEWSEYFEDYPEENPANYLNGSFDPIGAAKIRDKERNSKNNEVHTMIKNAKEKAKNKLKSESLFLVESCPQCGLKELNSYRINEHLFLCECQDCGIYGEGESHSLALKNTSDAIGEFKDWRDKF
ncbi:hypothetical protein OH457_21955 [Vibrio sp. 2art]|uniref:hypothetical protein n=1 Tax=Vibrio sp. 2art TaxID=2998832 RepID=UPI0022CD873F|nr:hypothetical protein [Vibrio sp. 2art]MDA0115905.1 hypothetical protein [Vibrio sp. 2art]